MEDVIEEILGTEIEDETDASPANHEGWHHPRNMRDMDYPFLKLLHERMASGESLQGDSLLQVVQFVEQAMPSLVELLSLRAPHSDSHVTHEALEEFLKRQAEVISIKRKAPGMLTSGLARQNSIDVNSVKLTDSQSGREFPTATSIKAISKCGHISADDLLFRRGKIANSCVIILDGNVRVLEGKEENDTVLGPWSVLALDALLVPEGTYVSDFTAFVDSESLRFVRISSFVNNSHSLVHNHRDN
jgi:hypothetical protein